jgi:hypothetical protein
MRRLTKVTASAGISNQAKVSDDGLNNDGGGIFVAAGAALSIDAFMLANAINNIAAIDPNSKGRYTETRSLMRVTSQENSGMRHGR